MEDGINSKRSWVWVGYGVVEARSFWVGLREVNKGVNAFWRCQATCRRLCFVLQ